MSESEQNPLEPQIPAEPEHLPPKIKDFLSFSTKALLRSGVTTFLRDFYSDPDVLQMYKLGLSSPDPDEVKSTQYHQKLEEAFVRAELPFAFAEDAEMAEVDRKFYNLVKVDEKGHVYLACEPIHITIIDHDDGSFEIESNFAEATKELGDTVKMLVDKQDELGWQPIYSPEDDMPLEIEDIPD